MNDADIASLMRRAGCDEIGESLSVLVSRTYCRISLVARNREDRCLLFVEAVVKYNVPLTPADLASRKLLVRRLGSLGFSLVQENGSKVYELRVGKEMVEEVMAGLIKI
jgi:hypothetical protein